MGGALWAAPFDIRNLVLTGPEVRVVEGVESFADSSFGSFAFSDNGRLIYLPGEEHFTQYSRLVWADQSGNREELRLPPGIFRDPELSPSGNELALTLYQDDGSSDVWLLDLGRETFSRRTFSGDARNPKWSPDGRTLVYYRTDRGTWRVNANGTRKSDQLLEQPDARPDSFTVDGDTLFYLQGPVGNADIMQLTYRDNDPASSPLMNAPYNEWGTAISPDGNWIAYVSNETGTSQVYVRPFPDLDGGKWQISTDVGSHPQWRGDGNGLFYYQALQGDELTRALMSVSVSTDHGFEASTPKPLITNVTTFAADPPYYEVTEDGERFILFTASNLPEPGENDDDPHFVVVENWFNELHRLAPTKPSKAD